MRTDISNIMVEMSDHEETDYESEYDDTDCESEDYGSDVGSDAGTCITFTSFEGAMAAMYEQFATLDTELGDVANQIMTLEKPVATMAVSTFVQPRVLESAPFRQTKFKVRLAARELLGLPQVATFAELCQAIRIQVRDRKEEAERMWGTTVFLDILQQLHEVVE
jgi:hypothetical protein